MRAAEARLEWSLTVFAASQTSSRLMASYCKMASILSQTYGSRTIVARLLPKRTFRFRRVGRIECGLDFGLAFGGCLLAFEARAISYSFWLSF